MKHSRLKETQRAMGNENVIARSETPSPVIARDKVPKQSHDRLGAGSAISKNKIATPSARNDRIEVFSVESLKLRVKNLICHSRSPRRIRLSADENGNPVLYDFPLLRAQHLDSCRSLSRTQIRGRNDRKFVPRHSPIHRFTHRDGFTLIETIMVMVIIAILAAVVIIRNPFDSIKLYSATRKVAADIRYVQKLSISNQTRAGITFNSNGYDVYSNIAPSTPAVSPGDTCSTNPSNQFVVDFTAPRCSNYSSVTISTSPLPLTIAFNSLGTPVAADGTALGPQTVTINYNGSQQINIEAGTGRVSY